MAQTSDRVSSIAGGLAKITADQLLARTATNAAREELAFQIRSMAASLLRQDEVKGVRKLLQKVGL
jgi:hypothetical protein